MIQFKIRRSHWDLQCHLYLLSVLLYNLVYPKLLLSGNCLSRKFILSENLEYGIFLKFKVSGIVYTEYLLSGNCVFITFRVQKLFFWTFLCPEIGSSKLFFSEFLLLLRNINTNSTINLKLLRNTALDKTYN